MTADADVAQVLRGRFVGFPEEERERRGELRLLDNVTDSVAERRNVRFGDPWEIPVEYPGAYTLTAISFDAPWRTIEPIGVHVREGSALGSMDVPLLAAAGFEGRVVTEEGAPIPLAEIEVHGEGYSGASCTAGRDGRFSVYLNLGGAYDVFVSAEGYVPASETLRLDAHEVRSLTLALRRAAAIGGTLHLTGGSALVQGSVFAVAAEWEASARAGPDGTFSGFVSQYAVMDVFAYGKDNRGRHYSGRRKFEPFEDLESMGIPLERAASAAGVLVDADGAPRADVWIEFQSEVSPSLRHAAVTAEDGSFSIPFLYPCAYGVTVGGSKEFATRVEAALPGEQLQLDLLQVRR